MSTRILEVFWVDDDRGQVGLLLSDGSTEWATETTIREAWESRYWLSGSEGPPASRDAYLDDLRGEAICRIVDGRMAR